MQVYNGEQIITLLCVVYMWQDSIKVKTEVCSIKTLRTMVRFDELEFVIYFIFPIVKLGLSVSCCRGKKKEYAYNLTTVISSSIQPDDRG